MIIEGFTPEEYAALWGRIDHDGAMFYNFSSERQVKDAHWLSCFIGAIARQIDQVRMNPHLYQPQDEGNLAMLKWYVETVLKR